MARLYGGARRGKIRIDDDAASARRPRGRADADAVCRPPRPSPSPRSPPGSSPRSPIPPASPATRASSWARRRSSSSTRWGRRRRGERLLSEIRARTPLPVRFAALTHLHRTTWAGAPSSRRAGAAVLAHENVRAWAHREFQEGLTPEQRARYAALRLPDVTYRDRVSLWLGDRRVEIFHLAGHSGSDSVVRVPDARVVFTGDLFSRRCLPGLGVRPHGGLGRDARRADAGLSRRHVRARPRQPGPGARRARRFATT